MWLFFQCVFEAVVEKGVRSLAEFVPGGGATFDIAKATIDKYRQACKDNQRCQDIEKRIREDIEQIANADSTEIKQAAAKIAQQAPEELRPIIQVYLEQIQASVRRSLKCSDNPEGNRVPADFSLQSAEDVADLLPPSLPRFKPGDALPGNSAWVLDRHLSDGGFGEVWLAHHAQFGMIGAVKFCKSLQTRDLDLLHEGNVIARLIRDGKHPNVVPLLTAHLDGDAPRLMYEYVEGGDLGDRIRHWTELPPAERQQKAVTALQHLTTAVGQFHWLNPPIIHRDFRPPTSSTTKQTSNCASPTSASAASPRAT